MGNDNKFLYDVVLLEEDCLLAHKNLNYLDKPTIWSYAEKHLEEHGKPLEIEGFAFVRAPIYKLERTRSTTSENSSLGLFATWAQYSCPKPGGAWAHRRFGLRHTDFHCFVGFPDGTWAISLEKIGLITVDLDKGTYESKPFEIQDGNKAIMDSNYKVLLDRDERVVKLKRIIDGFYPSWKKARHIYRNKLRENGELQKRFEREKAARDVEWTEQRMKLATAISALRDELDHLTKHLESDTMMNTHLVSASQHINKYVEVSHETRKQFYGRLKSKNKKKRR